MRINMNIMVIRSGSHNIINGETNKPGNREIILPILKSRAELRALRAETFLLWGKLTSVSTVFHSRLNFDIGKGMIDTSQAVSTHKDGYG